MEQKLINEFNRFAISKGISSNKMDYYMKRLDVSNIHAPNIIEERQLNISVLDIFSRMMMDRIVTIVGAIDENMSAIVQAQLLFLNSLDKTKDITCQINTPGGSVIHGLGIVDIMESIECDVSTQNMGICASMGSVLVSSGTKGKRYTLNSAQIMVHQASSGAQGHVRDNSISHYQTEKFNYLLMRKLAENSGQTFETIIELADRDRWLDSDESVKLGFVDDILIKEGVIPVGELMKGFDDYYNNTIMPRLRNQDIR